MKDKIAQAAVQEIAQRGLKFSIRDVAGRLGISTKTLYQHFESKEELVDHIVVQSIGNMVAEEEKLMKDDSIPLTDKLFLALTLLPQGVAFHDIRVMKELELRYPEQWRQIDAYMNTGWENIRLIIHEGAAAGIFRPFDVELFIQVYVGALYQLIDQYASGGRLTLQQALEQMVGFLMEGIRSPANR